MATRTRVSTAILRKFLFCAPSSLVQSSPSSPSSPDRRGAIKGRHETKPADGREARRAAKQWERVISPLKRHATSAGARGAISAGESISLGCLFDSRLSRARHRGAPLRFDSFTSFVLRRFYLAAGGSQGCPSSVSLGVVPRQTCPPLSHAHTRALIIFRCVFFPCSPPTRKMRSLTYRLSLGREKNRSGPVN